MAQALNRSLGTKMLAASLGVIVVVLSVFTVVAVLREQDKTMAGLREQGEVLVELLSRSTMLGVFAENQSMVREATRDIVSLRDVVSVSVYNNRFRKIHEERKAPSGPDEWQPPAPDEEAALRSTVVRETPAVIELIRPVELATGGTRDESLYFGMRDDSRLKVIGFVRVVLSKERYHREIASVIGQNVFITIVFILLAMALIFAAVRKVVRPLTNLTEKVQALGRGLPVEPVPVETADEVGNLAASFNETVRARGQAERSLRESEERYRRLIDLSPDAITVQHRGEIAFINPSGLTMLGLRRPGEIIGRRAEDFLEESFRPMVRQRLAEVEEQGILLPPHTVRYVRQDGTIVEAEIAAAPMPFSGDTAALVIARDQTERKGMEEKIRVYQKELFSVASEMSALESKVEERERHLIASDLHDYVGQNLAALGFMVGRLQRMLTDREQKRIVHQIGEALQETIQYTRSLTIELNPPILTELGFKPALDALVEAFRKTHGIAVRVEDDGRTKQVRGEARYLLFRSVRELLLNAVKHSAAREVTIRLAQEAEQLQVVVSDNGVGFVQGAKANSGFGLFSVQERLKRLGGSCTIESAPGRGTKIVLAVPLENSVTQGEGKT